MRDHERDDERGGDPVKKCFAILLAFALVCSIALAERASVGDTGYTLEIGEMRVNELTSAETINDIILSITDEATALECIVSMYDGYGITMEELSAEMLVLSKETCISQGMVQLNGAEVFYLEEKNEGMHIISYYLMKDECVMQFTWWFENDADMERISEMMNTLSMTEQGANE